MSQTNTCFCSDLQIGTETKLPGRFMGKQMYATLVDFGALPTADSQKSVPHGLTDLDQYGIDNGRSFVDQGNGSRHALFYPNTVPNAFWRAKVDESEVAIQVGEDRSSFTATVCVWYTKASEIAGPCECGDSGTAAGIDYSYAEQDTGLKWMDGRKVYQKTVSIGALPNTSRKEVPHGIVSVDFFIDFEVTSSRIASDAGGTASHPLPYVNTNLKPDICFAANGKHVLTVTNNDWSHTRQTYATLKYVCTDR